MSQSTSRKRPWLAALLAALVTGLGHLYLWRLRRAVGWLAASVLVTFLLVDQAAFETLAGGNPDTDALLAVWPMYAIVALSVVDAYLIARRPAAGSESSAHGEPTASSADEDDAPSCPHCGKDLDPDLEFCYWCTTPLGRDDDAEESTADASPSDGPR
ncbi:zinc ribbon domain-containing protein [Natronococcus sp. A-GB1]|uniref:zinc ribbon domain-containing protein n=1 Tax=Natronococcus sp. A-GB1 TaxID=3037648 RepID=UPI00241F0486|nr:zinc ribbon domain-containing protein [Natronococcus sp. A-GB1]MDG5760365.1 zinc ribbon domain-containing protein [Natronococcus sp. A-GB1]